MPNVSYAGPDRDRQLLMLLSIRKGVSVGKLVRDAVREKYGPEMDEEGRIFFASESADTHETNANDQGRAKDTLLK